MSMSFTRAEAVSSAALAISARSERTGPADSRLVGGAEGEISPK